MAKTRKPKPEYDPEKDPKATFGPCAECEWWKTLSARDDGNGFKHYCQLCDTRLAFIEGMRRMPEEMYPGLYVI